MKASFDKWWEEEGAEMSAKYSTREVAEIAWSNGAYSLRRMLNERFPEVKRDEKELLKNLMNEKGEIVFKCDGRDIGRLR